RIGHRSPSQVFDGCRAAAPNAAFRWCEARLRCPTPDPMIRPISTGEGYALTELRVEYERLLDGVMKPGRYLGNERGAVRKDPASVDVRFALAFPEVYEIAQ